MKRYSRIIFIFLLLILGYFLYAQEASQTDTIKAGFYINDIYDIDYKKGTYKISLFIWTNSYKKPYLLDQYIDIQKQIAFQTYLNYVDSMPDSKGRKVYWTEIEAVVEVLQNFNVSDFPFDKETLELNLEFTYDDSEVLFVQLDSTSVLDNITLPNGWKTAKPTFTKAITKYPTSFGDPQFTDYKVHTVRLAYTLSRDSLGLYLKLFLALFVSFLLAVSSIFITNETFEPRFGLIIGGLFGTIGNKYVTDGYLPESTSFNLSDKLHFLTIIYLLIITIITIIENRLKLGDNRKFEKTAFFSILLSYIILVLFLSW